MQAGFFAQAAVAGGKRDRTQAALLDAAIAVIARKGMEAAKISDMTDAAGLANGTFYNHFQTKDDILKKVAIKIAFEVSRRLDMEMAEIEDGPMRMVTATTRFVNLMLDSPDWAAVLLDSKALVAERPKEAFQFLAADLERCVEQGAIDEEIDQFTLEQVVALIRTGIESQLKNGRDADLTRRLCLNILRMLGMTRAKVIRVIEKYESALPTSLSLAPNTD
ncbi:TetR/AcrR family transcriptional regulator [Pyruvatibacter sp. HU-CL02332]|uniref:TetR/AcrR family transcriptional regulator n=1 Tax=Pyruvatibacter sp. HU-CL02332 TaxID=3127650 RepID=UPI003109AE59